MNDITGTSTFSTPPASSSSSSSSSAATAASSLPVSAASVFEVEPAASAFPLTPTPTPVSLAQSIRCRKSRAWTYPSELETPDSLRLDLVSSHLRWPAIPAISGMFDRKRGSLHRMTELPLDILLEIFGHLPPQDILYLSRASKRLRQILMSSSAMSVWKTSFSRLPTFPKCPRDMTEPQFASLAFDNYCHFCQSQVGPGQVFWSCRVRCCTKCLPRYFISECALEQLLMVICNMKFYHHDYLAIFPYIVYPKPKRNRPGRILYYLPLVNELIMELPQRRGSGVEAWRQQKELEQTQRLSHAAMCESWSSCWRYTRARDSNVLFILLFSVVLIFLWRDRFSVVPLI